MRIIITVLASVALFAACSGQQTPTAVTTTQGYGTTSSQSYAQATATPDGKNWKNCEPIDSGFGARAWHTCLGYDSKIVVIGGRAQDNKAVSEIWLSPDGEVWGKPQVTGSVEPFEKAAGTVLAGELLVTGGLNARGEAVNTVRSIKGVTVSVKETSGIFTPRSLHAMVTFNEKAWVLGGDSGKGLLNDVYSSADGAKWEKKETKEKIFTPRNSFGAAGLRDMIYVFGGQGKDGLLNDVWASKDGVDWEIVTASAAFTPRKGFAAYAYKDRLWLVGGETAGGPSSEVWWSVNGIHWVSATAKPGFTPRSGLGAAIVGENVFITGGADSTGITGDVWSTK